MSTRVFIADDHAIVREGLRRILAAHPEFEVLGEAQDGHEALAAVRRGGFDVLLLDLSMPGRRGVELIKLIKSERPELRVLVLSMHDEQQFAVRSIRAGASGYLTKDTAPQQLVAAIRKVGDGGLFITPAVAETLALGLQAPDARPLHESLTDREHEILLLLAGGESVGAIAERLHLSAKTVSTHKSNICEKLRIGSIAELVRYALDHKLLESPDAPR